MCCCCVRLMSVSVCLCVVWCVGLNSVCSSLIGLYVGL